MSIERIQKLSFRSAGKRQLGDLPSNQAQSSPPLRSPWFSRPRRRKRKRYLAFLAAFVAVPLILATLLQSGLFAPLIEGEAIASLERVLPETLDANIGVANVGVRGLDGLGVIVDRFALNDKQTGETVFSVDKMRIGVNTLSALRGRPQVRRLTLDGVRLSVPEFQGSGAYPAVSGIEKSLAALFDASNKLFDRTTINGQPVSIEVNDMLLSGDDGLLVRRAVVLARTNQRALEAEVEYGGQTIALAAMLRRADANSMTVWLTADGVPMPARRLRTIFSAVESDHLPDANIAPVLADIRINAQRLPGDAPDELSLSIEPKDLSFKLDEGDLVDFTGRLNFAWVPARRVLSLEDSPVRIGRSSAVLTGGLRDAPEEAVIGDDHNYQFELLANNGVSNPEDSPERPVKFALRALGISAPGAGRSEFTRIEIKSPAGYAEGAGTIDFSGGVPTAVFAISVEDFALAGVKQFWPASVARAARRWVLSNLAGGRVSEGEFLIAEPLRRRVPGSDEKLEGDTELWIDVEGVRFDVAGDIPPVRDATGRVEFKGGEATMTLESGTAYLPSGRTAAATDGKLVIHREDEAGRVFADLDVMVSGNADALGELISFRPISAKNYRDYEAEDLSGDVDAQVTMRFVLNPDEDAPGPDWNVVLDVENAAIATPFEGRMLSEMEGRIIIDRARADIDVAGLVDGLPAEIAMIQPFGGDPQAATRDVVLKLSNADRAKIAPGLEPLINGVTAVRVKSQGADEGEMAVDADLTTAELALPWIGWTKGSGIEATTAFNLLLGEEKTEIRDFELDGGTFSASGDIVVGPDGLQLARFGKVRLNNTDDISVSIESKGAGYAIAIGGTAFDARALIRHIRKEMSSNAEGDGVPVELTAKVARVRGFGDEALRDLDLSMRHDGKDVTSLTVTATSVAGFPVSFRLEGVGASRRISLEALDGGELLRFLDIYGQVRGGVLTLSLSGSGPKSLSGRFDLNDFRIFNEPRLNALVSSKSGDSASLNEAIQRNIDTREVKFDRASASMSVTPSSLEVTNAVLRGPEVGATLRGTVYDENNNMRIAGTFMPAYALNSLLSNVPIVGLVLGNGRDRGLIGVTFLLEGDAKKPKITVNPLSLIAPGVFRSIFEFR